LGEIARSPSLFRNGAMQSFSLARARAHTADYVAARKTHFRIVWRQTLFVIFLEAVASTLLLGLGGWLVINRQLTLGQLVASELIVTLVLAALAKSGKHLESFYDLEASLDKLGVIDSFPLEPEGGEVLLSSGKPLAVKAVVPGHSGTITLDAPTGARIAVLGAQEAARPACSRPSRFSVPPRERVSPLTASIPTPSTAPRSGASSPMSVGGGFSGTILENLRAGRDGIGVERIREALRTVGLDARMSALPAGMATPLSSTGSPLSASETVLLGIARAMLASPRLLLLDGTLDLVDPSLIGGSSPRLPHPMPTGPSSCPRHDATSRSASAPPS